MKIQQKIVYLMLLGFAAYQVQLTDSNRLMKGYNWTGPNQGPVARKESDIARRTLYGMAGFAALGLVFRKEKKE